MSRVYRDSVTDAVAVVSPAYDPAMTFYQRLKAAMAAEAAYDEAMAAVPEYTGPRNPIDYYGREEEAFNRAVDELFNSVETITKDIAQQTAREVVDQSR